MSSTTEAKTSFTETGDQITAKRLLELLEKKGEKFPLLREGIDIVGELGKTGVVISSNGNVVAALRHPNTIPKDCDPDSKKVTFGGSQGENMLETSLGIPIGEENAAQVADMILTNFRRVLMQN